VAEFASLEPNSAKISLAVVGPDLEISIRPEFGLIMAIPAQIGQIRT
jgi:hypothetical protein